jgi:hypothetical protein
LIGVTADEHWVIRRGPTYALLLIANQRPTAPSPLQGTDNFRRAAALAGPGGGRPSPPHESRRRETAEPGGTRDAPGRPPGTTPGGSENRPEYRPEAHPDAGRRPTQGPPEGPTRVLPGGTPGLPRRARGAAGRAAPGCRPDAGRGAARRPARRPGRRESAQRADHAD